jgi:hypothetical protein
MTIRPGDVVAAEVNVAGRIDRVELRNHSQIPAVGIPAEIQDAGGRFLRQDPIRHGVGRREWRAPEALGLPHAPRERRRLDFYWCVWRPLGIDDSLWVWLLAPAGRARARRLDVSTRSAAVARAFPSLPRGA